MPTIIRPARKDDLLALLAISNRTIRACYSPFLGEERVEAWLTSGAVGAYFRDHLRVCRVLETEGRVIGLGVTIGPKIDLLMIDRDWQRRGFGRTLLRHLERQLLEDHTKITVESFVDNSAANRFYESQGWTRGERLPATARDPAKFRYMKRQVPAPR